MNNHFLQQNLNTISDDLYMIILYLFINPFIRIFAYRVKNTYLVLFSSDAKYYINKYF